VVEGLSFSQKKKSFFCPQNDKLGSILTQFLTERKHGQSREVLGHGFYGSIAKRTLQKQYKNVQKFTVRTKEEAVAPLPS